MSQLIATFPGIGTTTAIKILNDKHNVKAVDVEPPRAGFLSDPTAAYAQEIVEQIPHAQLVFFRPSVPLLDQLLDQGHPVTLVLPNTTDLDAYIQAQRDRGLSQEDLDILDARLKGELEVYQQYTFPRPIYRLVVLPAGKGLDEFIQFFV